MRVVTLLPSATEIVYALGVEPVGVSHECDHPPAATDLPPVNRSRIDPAASSSEINQQVATAAAGDGVYAVDREALAAVEPDLVITQGVCDVCAVDHVLVEDAVGALGLDADVLTMDVHSLADLFATIERIGTAVGRGDAAADLVARLQSRVTAVKKTVADVEKRPRAAVLDWLDPVMVAGHWVPEMVQLGGGRYGMEDDGAHSRPREWGALREYDPDVLVVAPCGFDLDQARENIDDVTGRAGWSDLQAVREGRVYLFDGHHYVNGSGPRLVETLEFLASVLHPDRFETPPADAVQSLTTVAR